MDSRTYLYAVDLFNHAYWWECHEQWEAIWKQVGPESDAGRFLQALVQVAAGNLRRFMGSHDRGKALLARASAALLTYKGIYCGVDVDRLRADVNAQLDDGAGPPVLVLQGLKPNQQHMRD